MQYLTNDEFMAYDIYMSLRASRTEGGAEGLAESLAPHLDCLSCGACCRIFAVPVEESEVNRLNGRYYNLAGSSYMRTNAYGTCEALRTKKDGSCKCSIYDKKPKVCGEFVKGGFQCIGARANQRKGLGGLELVPGEPSLSEVLAPLSPSGSPEQP